MQRTATKVLVATAILSFSLLGCSDDDPLPHPEILSFTLSPTTAAAGDTVTATVELENFDFVDEHEAQASVAPDGDHGGASNNIGHIHIYLDELMSNPLAMPITPVFDFALPDDVTVGEHSLIIRLHRADHLIIEPQVTEEAAITIE